MTVLELLTIKEAAEQLKVHPETVRRHIAAGALKAQRAGRQIRIRPADLAKYLAAVR